MTKYMSNLENKQKCSCCSTYKLNSFFIKEGKLLKCCLNCREIQKHRRAIQTQKTMNKDELQRISDNNAKDELISNSLELIETLKMKTKVLEKRIVDNAKLYIQDIQNNLDLHGNIEIKTYVKYIKLYLEFPENQTKPFLDYLANKLEFKVSRGAFNTELTEAEGLEALRKSKLSFFEKLTTGL